MTQQKSKKVKKANKPIKQPSLGDMFRSLAMPEQEKVINFFNTQRIVQWIYSECSEESRKYIDYCIELSIENQKTEVQQTSTELHFGNKKED